MHVWSSHSPALNSAKALLFTVLRPNSWLGACLSPYDHAAFLSSPVSPVTHHPPAIPPPRPLASPQTCLHIHIVLFLVKLFHPIG